MPNRAAPPPPEQPELSVGSILIGAGIGVCALLVTLISYLDYITPHRGFSMVAVPAAVGGALIVLAYIRYQHEQTRADAAARYKQRRAAWLEVGRRQSAMEEMIATIEARQSAAIGAATEGIARQEALAQVLQTLAAAVEERSAVDGDQVRRADELLEALDRDVKAITTYAARLYGDSVLTRTNGHSGGLRQVPTTPS